MTQTKSEANSNVIKLTRDELMSEHVDELLQRQMSLRGEPALLEKKRQWYFRNWFIFMVAGFIGAVIAFAIIEPYYDDFFYIQGAVEEINENEKFFKIRGDRIQYDENTNIYNGDETEIIKFTSQKVKEGQEIGAYIYPVRVILKNNNFAWKTKSVKLAVTDAPPKKSQKTLSELYSIQFRIGLIFFSIVAGCIGLAIGIADGVICRAFSRALIGGGIGLLIGLIGGLISGLLANLIYSPLRDLAQSDQLNDSLKLLLQIAGRALGWGIAGTSMGLGYGISLRSKRLTIYGLIGGTVGGLLGGMFFDPIGLLFETPFSGQWSRLFAIAIIGATVGLTIGIVELIARKAWLRMTEGPLAGKEFILFKDIMKIGSSPKNEIFLFNDPRVKEIHAKISMAGDEYDIESQDRMKPVLVNNQPIKSRRLYNGDRITIGKTSFVFEKREG